MVLSRMIYFSLQKACLPFQVEKSVDHSVQPTNLVWSPMNWLSFKVVLGWRYPILPKQRGKKLKHQASSPKHYLRENPIDLWSCVWSFGSIGNHVQNKVMVQLWFGIRVKHLPVWVFIHHEWFYSQFQFDPTFPLNVHLKAKRWHPTLHFRLQGKLFLHKHIVSLKIWCSREWFIFPCSSMFAF